MKLHFIAGLPRSGSTLLSAILRQNPRVCAGVSSPLAYIFNNMQESMGKQNEAHSLITPERRSNVLRGLFDSYYSGCDLVFDTNRRWPCKISALVELFPDCRFICCVRTPSEVLASIERQIRKNPNRVPSFFGGKMGGSVYERTSMLCSPSGMIGFAMSGLREAFYGPLSARMLFLEYGMMVTEPKLSLDAVYEWIGEPPFEHDFTNVQPIPGVEDFDEDLGSPGLHAVSGPVRAPIIEYDLPPDIVEGCPPAFWR